MKWLTSIAIALVLSVALSGSAQAGRTEGPMSVTVMVPAGQTVSYDVTAQGNVADTSNPVIQCMAFG